MYLQLVNRTMPAELTAEPEQVDNTTEHENSGSENLENSFDTEDVEDEAHEVPPMPHHNIQYIEAYDTYICGPGRHHPITVSLTNFTCSACGGRMGKKSP